VKKYRITFRDEPSTEDFTKIAVIDGFLIQAFDSKMVKTYIPTVNIRKWIEIDSQEDIS
jgi:hypothetical protein